MEEQAPPRVTALIVSRNQADQLRRCVQSLERSTDRQRLEVLVVDDGSQDDSSAVPDEFPDVISLKLPKRLGWTRAVNIGLRTAKGDLVLLMRPTFEVEPDTVARMADKLEGSASVGAVCPGIKRAWRFPDSAALIHAWQMGDLPGAIELDNSGEHSVDYPSGSPIMTRRELLRAMHYLDERFGDHWADLEMCWRIKDGGKQILVLPDVTMHATATEEDDALTELEWADSANGVATWIGLHHGTIAGLTARLKMAFHALGRGKTSVFMGILTGSKIDGNQE